MTTCRVPDVIAHDHWAGADGLVDAGQYIVRFRTPILGPGETGEYIHRLSVTWPYADEESGEMPDEADSHAMRVFEDRLVEAWEHESNAILTAVLTFDGARQWVFYTRDVDLCGNRLCEMPQEEDPYPIELITDEDPTWQYLREEILGRLSWQQHQEEWRESLERNTEQA